MNKKEIQDSIDTYINKLYFDKSKYAKARKYYNMQRDNSDYAYLEDNYGIGNPFDIQFSSLLRLRIDILVGLFMSQELDFVVDTIDPKVRKKEQHHINKLKEKAIDVFIDKMISSKSPISYEESLKMYDEVQRDYVNDENIAIFRKQAQHIVKYYTKNSMYDFYSKVEKMALDMFLTGEYIYRMLPVKKGRHPDIINVLPERTFFRVVNGDNDIQTSDAVVNVRYLTKRQVLNDLGMYMTASQKKEFIKNNNIVTEDGGLNYYAALEGINHLDRELYNNGEDYDEDYYANDTFYYDNNPHLDDVVKVYHVEFKHVENLTDFEDNDNIFRQLGLIKGKKKKKLVEILYEGYRIGGEYYIGTRRVDEAERNPLDEDKVLFSYRGISFNSPRKPPTGKGYGLIDYQDMKDILIYIRNNLIANSGSNGSRVNFAAIPAFMGEEPFERIKTFLAYKKQGIEAYDTSQKGSEGFQHYGDFSAMIDGPALQAIDYTISTVDNFADEICGISPQMRGQIEQRVAVNNVKTGIRMVSYANKRIYHALDSGIGWALMSLVGRTQYAFSEGFSGTYREADKEVYFTINKESYIALKITVGVIRKEVDEVKRQEIKQLLTTFASNGLATPESLIDSVDTNSIQDLKIILNKGIKEQKEKNDALMQMKQQLEQINNAYKELKNAFDKQQAQLQKISEEENKRKWEEFELKKKEIENNILMKKKEEELKEKELDAVNKRTELEKYQVDVSRGRATEVKNLKI